MLDLNKNPERSFKDIQNHANGNHFIDLNSMDNVYKKLGAFCHVTGEIKTTQDNIVFKEFKPFADTEYGEVVDCEEFFALESGYQDIKRQCLSLLGELREDRGDRAAFIMAWLLGYKFAAKAYYKALKDAKLHYAA